ncbi:acyl-CoA dehydrogenase [Nitrospirillum bahiense]|uniref:Acyl-CoA dehydrogenase n=1 Tax=Nitrospirillum amazonense TaxID=28077 RepID=A0A560FVN6_9PROT|nr:acyl-CoA dehydrogenase [Nitrospirillum amazonense]TWB25652.1 acyl-CoA dehydrogenase [Nitrospirillum amazonense]
MSETSEIVRDMSARLFADLATPARLYEAEAGVWDQPAWDRVQMMGLPLALVPEEAGGVGLEAADAAGLVASAATTALPVPLAETMLANRLLADAGLPLAEGPATLAPARPGDRFTLERRGAGWHLHGGAERVPWASIAGDIVIVAEAEGQVLAARVARSDVTPLPGRNLALEPRDRLEVDLELPGDAVAPLPAGITICHPLALGAAFRTVALAGAAARVLDMTVAYANERSQFGRPIGKFQAVQQSLALMAGQVAATKGAADLAAGYLDAYSQPGEADPLPVAIGKARAGEAAGMIAAIAHQVHGAIGFTHEHALHFLTKRLWSWRDEFGNDAHWQRLIGRRMAAAGPEGLWPLLTTL